MMARNMTTTQILLGQLEPAQPTTTTRLIRPGPFSRLGSALAPPKNAPPPINPDVDATLAALGLRSRALAPTPALHAPAVSLEVLNVARGARTVSRPGGQVDDAGAGATTSPTEYSRSVDAQVKASLPPDARKISAVQAGIGAAVVLWLVAKVMD